MRTFNLNKIAFSISLVFKITFLIDIKELSVNYTYEKMKLIKVTVHKLMPIIS
jgi:hypothetical protein